MDSSGYLIVPYGGRLKHIHMLVVPSTFGVRLVEVALRVASFRVYGFLLAQTFYHRVLCIFCCPRPVWLTADAVQFDPAVRYRSYSLGSRRLWSATRTIDND